MFQGSGVAIVTPFRDGAFDEEAFRGLIEFHVQGGTDFIVPCGTTGESPTLSHEEHRRVIRTAVEAAAGRVQVVAGTGSNNTAEAIDLTRFAKEAGADAALIICPYYNKPTQAGLIAHFRALIETCAFPLVIYNIQGRTAINMTPETMARLAESPEIVGVKEASGNLAQMSEIIRLTQGMDFDVLSGDDALTLPLMAVGGVGVISVVSNLIPADVKAMVSAALIGDFATARKWHYRMLPLTNAMFVETNPIPVKAALALTGRITDEVRLPMTAPSEANQDLIKRALTDYGVL
jgi:4-hydroxy-tetrahydrodipicolinate synthase